MVRETPHIRLFWAAYEGRGIQDLIDRVVASGNIPDDPVFLVSGEDEDPLVEVIDRADAITRLRKESPSTVEHLRNFPLPPGAYPFAVCLAGAINVFYAPLPRPATRPVT
jgi:hypothetical protein